MRDNDSMHPKEFLVGAAIGSLLGGVSALLTAPTSGQKMRECISDSYCDMQDKAHHFADTLAEKKKCLSKMMGCESSCDWTDSAKDMLCCLSDKFKSLTGKGDSCMDHGTKDFVIGGVIGGILGVIVAGALATKSGKNLRHDISDAYHNISDRTHDFTNDLNKRGRSFAKSASNGTNNWIKFAKHLMDELSDDAHSASEQIAETAKHVRDHQFSDIIDLASMGWRMWQKMKK